MDKAAGESINIEVRRKDRRKEGGGESINTEVRRKEGRGKRIRRRRGIKRHWDRIRGTGTRRRRTSRDKKAGEQVEQSRKQQAGRK